MRVLIDNRNGRLFEAQSGGAESDLDVLRGNARSAGIPDDAMDARIVTHAEFAALVAAGAGPPPTDGDRAASQAAADPFMRAIVKLLAAQSPQIWATGSPLVPAAPKTVAQVIAILKPLA